MVRIVDRGGAQNMGSVWVLCKNPTPATSLESALETRLAASFNPAKKGILILAPIVGGQIHLVEVDNGLAK
jgi:hypothetical protein